MSKTRFLKTLKKGTPLQEEVMSKLKRWMKVIHYEYGHPGICDIIVELATSQRRYLLHDVSKSPVKGCVCIPLSKNGEAYGVNNTETNFWIYKVGTDHYQLSVPKLQKLIEEGNYHRLETLEIKKDEYQFAVFSAKDFSTLAYKL